VPEENFQTLWCKARLTEADTPTIRLGATPSGPTSADLHRPPCFINTSKFVLYYHNIGGIFKSLNFNSELDNRAFKVYFMGKIQLQSSDKNANTCTSLVVSNAILAKQSNQRMN